MHPGVISCASQTPLGQVAKLMVDHNVHAVFVDGLAPGRLTHEPVVQAFLTDRDLMRAAGNGHLDAEAGESITSQMVAIGVDEGLVHAAAVMAREGCSHLVVLSADKRESLGVLSSMDIAAVLASARSA